MNPEVRTELALDRLRVEFTQPETERDFQLHHLSRTQASLRLTLLFCSLFYVAFSLTDVAVLGQGRAALCLLAARTLVAVTAVLGLHLVRQQPESVNSVWFAASIAEIVGMSTFMLIVWFRPHEIPWHAMSLCIMLIVVYVFIPNRLWIAQGIALAATAAFILLAVRIGKLEPSDAQTMAMLLLLVNSFGIVAARRYHRLWRDEYRVLMDLQQLSVHDPLTACFNRRHLHQTLLPMEIARARRFRHWLTLMVCDIDRLKSINDTYGHQAGDVVLQRVAAQLRSASRDHVDSVVRFGGEEFLVVLPQTDLDGALAVAERLRAAIAGRPEVDNAGLAIAATASFGVLAVNFATVGESVTEASLVAAADALLYEAKHAGRNTIRYREWGGRPMVRAEGSLPLTLYESSPWTDTVRQGEPGGRLVP